MKKYTGLRDIHGTALAFVNNEPLDPRLDLDNHSPTGFEWGYGGSGPAQLALAILADALGDDRRAVRLHQAFKWRIIAKLPRDEMWWLDDQEVRDTADLLACEVSA